MRVLYSFPNQLGKSGIGTTSFKQIQYLKTLGLSVDVICSSLARRPDQIDKARTTLTLLGRRIPHRLLGVDNAFNLHDKMVASYLRRHSSDYDVVHCWPLGAERTIREAHRQGIPVVLERPNSHTAFAYRVVEEECRLLKFTPPAAYSHAYNSLRLCKELREYASADYILTPSDFVRKSFVAEGVPNERLLNTQYGCDLVDFPFVKRERYEHSGRDFKAVFLGRCEPRKGLHYALRAWCESKASKIGSFHIYGDFVPGYQECLNEWLSHPSISLHPFSARPADEFSRSDVMILSSVEEGSALVTYEARASGCVNLISSSSGAVGRDGVDVLLHQPRDYKALKLQLNELISTPSLLGRLREASLVSRSGLSWLEAAKTLVAAYECASRGCRQMD